MHYLKNAITKKEAKIAVAETHQIYREAARRAKNVQTKTYLNIIADNLLQSEKLADARTR
tara:strand:- start:2582 stop:2761 length:180 start_codon:yes stop_codon:yes gene_type:complete